MNNNEKRIKYDVMRGGRMGQIEDPRYLAGYALSFEGVNYFVLKFWFQPERTYFICPNGKETGHYTIYSRRIGPPGGAASFQNPIGNARPAEDRFHLELILPDFPRRYYLNLQPILT